jgi:hypothetical protein
MSDGYELDAVLTEVWRRLADTVERHYAAGRSHLLTEDVIRFATVALLEDHGIDPRTMAIEVPMPGSPRAKIDLTIGRHTAIEFKFPRDPRADVGSADTMTFGEMLAVVYRLAALPYERRLAVWLVHERLGGYLSRTAQRHGFTWPDHAGDGLALPDGLAAQLRPTAAAALPLATRGAVRARVLAHTMNSAGVRLTVLSVVDPAPALWPQTPPTAAARPLRQRQQGQRPPGGVRREILDAVDAIAVRSGSPLFTARDVADEMLRRGTRYAASTITTMVTSHMCVDGDSIVEWPDLRRVDRGVYRRITPGEEY